MKVIPCRAIAARLRFVIVGVSEAIERHRIFHDSSFTYGCLPRSLCSLAMTNRDVSLALNMTIENFAYYFFVIASEAKQSTVLGYLARLIATRPNGHSQ